MYNVIVFRGITPFLYFFRWSKEGTLAITNYFAAQGYNVEVVDS
jgi:hypothetical protein